MRLRIGVNSSLRVLLLLAAFAVSGCEEEEEINGVRFKNQSSHTVTVTHSFVKGPYDSDFAQRTIGAFELAPGASHDETSFTDTVYYDWQPKNAVDASQPRGNVVVFTDKPTS